MGRRKQRQVLGAEKVRYGTCKGAGGHVACEGGGGCGAVGKLMGTRRRRRQGAERVRPCTCGVLGAEQRVDPAGTAALW
jgi:hypothetical protein